VHWRTDLTHLTSREASSASGPLSAAQRGHGLGGEQRSVAAPRDDGTESQHACLLPWLCMMGLSLSSFNIRTSAILHLQAAVSHNGMPSQPAAVTIPRTPFACNEKSCKEGAATTNGPAHSVGTEEPTTRVVTYHRRQHNR